MRYNQGFKYARNVQITQCIQGNIVIFLHQQLDIQEVAWVINVLDIPDQLGYHLTFFVYGELDGVGGELVFIEGQHFIAGDNSFGFDLAAQ